MTGLDLATGYQPQLWDPLLPPRRRLSDDSINDVHPDWAEQVVPLFSLWHELLKPAACLCPNRIPQCGNAVIRDNAEEISLYTE
ncbi:hypothetical protein BaRGS_00020094 [Batillaria attramentaria]|uniref:Uncharacterized protein n=1 Tax=Batillaria attramentaria TaxID=370345 RepID=A0ABD0KNE5_9CAEN